MSFIPRKYCCDGCSLISTDGRGWYAVAPLAEGHLATSPSQIHYCPECMVKMRLAVTAGKLEEMRSRDGEGGGFDPGPPELKKK